MRVPLSWLAEHVDLPPDLSAREVAEALVAVGLEVETVEEVSAGLSGPLVVGRVLASVDEPQSNGKTIRWCTVEVGEPEPRGIVCGAHNFSVGDTVVVALPGAVLPGGFAIAARKTYGHVSDGMICSLRELALGDDHTGILVLSEGDAAGASPGDDARPLLGLPDAVLDIAVTPDRGYCLSVRGVAREAAGALGLPFRDAAQRWVPAGGADGWPVRVDDPTGCDRFVTRSVHGLDPTAESPFWLRRRLTLAGMRPISLAVDVTNYVMLELGQPLHAYDRGRLDGAIVVRRATAGESIETLDGATRPLDTDDLLITDGSGPIGIAGVMGGATTEMLDGSTAVVVEAAHFDPVAIARASRRHRLSSEASRRFERGVDPALAPAAADRAVELLVTLGGATADPGGTDLDLRVPMPPVELDLGFPGRLVGVDLPADEVVRHLETVGCTVSEPGPWGTVTVAVPSWRPDLMAPADLVEEVARLHGYASIPSVLPPVVPAPDRALPDADVVRVARALVGAGFVEVRSYPFVGEAALDALGLPPDDARRRALRLANPLSDEEPLLRTTLLPGLLAAARRNVGRGFPDLALFETGRVFRPRAEAPPAPRPPVDHAPGAEVRAALDAALPDQPVRVAGVLTGAAEPAGWWGRGRAAGWADAVEAVRTVAAALGAEIEVEADEHAPWHPGRCAAVRTRAGDLVGHAGELHPGVCTALGLPPRTSAFELSVPVLASAATAVPRAPHVSTYPMASQDVALVVDAGVPAAAVEAALVAGAGPLLESLRLFDVYEGDQVGPGRRSLAYALRFRAPDRTLTAEEASQARDAAVAEATARVGATLRS
jgi:phenylalanyl-tRNA synthetase beta chain